MKFAKKLPFTFADGVAALNEFKHLRVLGLYGKEKDSNKYCITKKYVPKKAVKLFQQTIPEPLVPHLIGITKAEISTLAPHIHTDESCVINFYSHTNGEITSIYDGDIKIYDGDLEDNGNGYYLVDPAGLTKVEQFVAQDGDVWLLNTKQPHSVDALGAPVSSKRTVIQAFFNLPYTEVSAYL